LKQHRIEKRIEKSNNIKIAGPDEKLCPGCDTIFTPEVSTPGKLTEYCPECAPAKGGGSSQLDDELQAALLLYYPKVKTDDHTCLELDAVGTRLQSFFAQTKIKSIDNVASYATWLGAEEDNWPAIYNKLKMAVRGLSQADFGRINTFWSYCRNVVDERESDSEDEPEKSKSSKVSTALMPAPDYKKMLSQYQLKRKLPKNQKPSHGHISKVWNHHIAGMYPVLAFKEMTNSEESFLQNRDPKAASEPSFEWTTVDGAPALTPVQMKDPLIMSPYKVVNKLRCHDATCAVLGYAEQGAWEDHIQEVLRLGDKFGTTRGKEILDGEFCVRGAISDAYLENGGDLGAAIETVYSTGVATDIWRDKVIEIDADATYLKQKEKKKPAKDDNSHNSLLTKIMNMLADKRAPTETTKTSNAALSERLGLSWSIGGKRLCYAHNLEGVCKSKNCQYLHACPKCGSTECKGLKSAHLELYLQFMSGKGKGKGSF